jgi:oligopeptide transport system substrate-binding protein
LTATSACRRHFGDVEQINVKTELLTPRLGALRRTAHHVGRAGWLSTTPIRATPSNQDRHDADGTMNWGNNYGRYSNPKFDELLNRPQGTRLAKGRAPRGAEKLAWTSSGHPLAYYSRRTW